jgi:FkbM family methyltransferase
MQRVFTRLLEVLASATPGHKVRTVFDVGARDCEESRHFARAFPEARVYAFECNPATLPSCRAAAASEPRIHLTESAASNCAGSIPFYPIDQQRTVTGAPDGNPGASSMFRATGRYLEEQYVQEEIEVPTLRLDAFMRDRGIDEVDILWMDVQGAESLVLEGLGGRLRDVRCLHLEVEFFEIYAGQALFDDVDPYLRDRGFRLLGFTSYSRYAADALYLRDDIEADVASLQRQFPYLSRNLGKMRTHRLKRSMRKIFGLPAWPEGRASRL